jgi:hypothetical protein
MDLRENILAYYGALAADQHHRYRSWEHCYTFFRQTTPARILEHREQAALQLGFYLASWGMYRNSFLLRCAYTVHLGAVDCLASPPFKALWAADVGSQSDPEQLAATILAAIDGIRAAYRPYDEPTDTLVTKVLLGTVGCLPACDRFFIDGFKKRGFSYSCLNGQFVGRILRFCADNATELRDIQAGILSAGAVQYPMMKLVDMYFWQVGYEASSRPAALDA